MRAHDGSRLRADHPNKLTALDLVKLLLDKGADVNATRVDGSTALHAAVHADRLDVTDALLRAGARAAAANRYGVTPLSLAASQASPALVEALLTAGADPNRALPSISTARPKPGRAEKWAMSTA